MPQSSVAQAIPLTSAERVLTAVMSPGHTRPLHISIRINCCDRGRWCDVSWPKKPEPTSQGRPHRHGSPTGRRGDGCGQNPDGSRAATDSAVWLAYRAACRRAARTASGQAPAAAAGEAAEVDVQVQVHE